MSNPRVTGAIRYAQDVEFEGMLHVRLPDQGPDRARVGSRTLCW